LSVAKSTKEINKYITVSNPSIKVMQDALNNYTHKKLERVFEDSEIRKAFRYFVQHGSKEALDSIPSENREVYEEYLQEFIYNFSL